MSDVVTVNGTNHMCAVAPKYNGNVTVVLGAQWGDEGKGKVVDMLATEVDVVCRCQVGLPLAAELSHESSEKKKR